MNYSSIPFHDISKPEILHILHAKNHNFPAHFHQSVEILHVSKGRLEIHSQDTSYSLQAGDTIIFFPNIAHRIITNTYSELFAILLQPDLLSDFYLYFMKYQPDCPVIAKDNVPFSFINCIHSFFEYVITTSKIKDPSQKYWHSFHSNNEIRFAKGYVQLILSYIFENLELIPQKHPSRHNPVIECLNYVSSHYQAPITLEDIAREIGVSRVQVSRIFSNKIGCSFPQYLSELRLSHAQHLLKTTNMSIIEISNDSGFGSLSSFYQAFQKKYGVSPKKLQNNILQNNQL